MENFALPTWFERNLVRALGNMSVGVATLQKLAVTQEPIYFRWILVSGDIEINFVGKPSERHEIRLRICRYTRDGSFYVAYPPEDVGETESVVLRTETDDLNKASGFLIEEILNICFPHRIPRVRKRLAATKSRRRQQERPSDVTDRGDDYVFCAGSDLDLK